MHKNKASSLFKVVTKIDENEDGSDVSEKIKAEMKSVPVVKNIYPVLDVYQPLPICYP